MMGSPGQSNYAAANAFLDALMQQRHQQGLPGLSINWGPWAESGMAAPRQDRMQQQGMSMIAPHQGKLLFRYLRNQPIAQIGVLPFKAEKPAQKQPVREQDFNRQAYQAMSKEERRTQVTNLLRSMVAAVGGFADAQMDNQQSLLSMGLDSLMAVQARNQAIQARWQVL